jgi:hypothetical protein
VAEFAAPWRSKPDISATDRQTQQIRTSSFDGPSIERRMRDECEREISNDAGRCRMKRLKPSAAFFLSGALAIAGAQGGCSFEESPPIEPQLVYAGDQPTAQPEPLAGDAEQSTGRSSAEQLNQLVAPIALYPDALVAQILAASTYPTEIVEADRWMQQHSSLTGESLAQEVDKQSWDPSVKALTQVPSVLANMDKNLSWSSALGDAYMNQQQDVLNAIQVMRRRAQQAGNLKSTPQETVTAQGQTIVIEPANPAVVYVPAYDPWLAYGPPVVAYPGWVPVPGLFYDGPGPFFGLGFGIGIFAGFGWGWHRWGADWHGHGVVYNHNAYVSHSRTFANHGNFDRGRADFGHAAAFHAAGFHGGPAGGPAFHGAAEPHGVAGVHSGAFSGFDHGGVARGFAFRGRSSFGGGFHGGGFHGGGRFHGGGGHR